MSDALTGVSDAELLKTFSGASIVHAFGEDVSVTTARLQDFKTIANDNVGTGQRLLDLLDKQGVSTKGYQKILDDAVQSEKNRAQTQKDTKATSDALLSSTDAQTASTRAANDAIAAYRNGTGTATDALKALTTAQQATNDALSLYKQQLQEVQGVQGDVTAAQIALSNAQQSGLDTLVKSGAQFDITTQAGRDNISALQQQVSAEDALAEAIFKKTGNQADADASLAAFTQHLDDNLTALTGSKQAADAIVTSLGLIPPAVAPVTDTLGDLGKAFGGASGQAALAKLIFGDSSSSISSDAQTNLALALGAASSFAGEFTPTVSKAGSDAATAFGQGVSTVAPKAGEAVNSAGAAVSTAGAALSSENGPAFLAGLNVGTAFDTGMADGITTFSFLAEIAAVQMVAATEKAARIAAKSQSPSQLFADLGNDLALGLAAGMDAGGPAVAGAGARLIDASGAAVRITAPIPGTTTTAGSGQPGTAPGTPGSLIGSQTNVFQIPVPDPFTVTREIGEATRHAMFLGGF
jgi:hypothetical protein